jgi:NAD(P)-dependent dehydrogenase (short-subunit alcohol dehydrogenase family)
MALPKPVLPRVAVITGGGRGIGFACARTFARSGFHVVFTSRDQDRLQTATAELKALKTTALAVPCDVSDPGSVEALFAEIRRHYSSIEVLINNAGVAHAGSTVEKLPLDTWRQVINTNLTGMFLVTRSALPMMGAGATIVNNLSIAAVHPFAGMSAYAASKSGGLGFTNVLREEVRQRGIRVLALLPGATATEIWQQFWPDAPVGKMISPDAVADAVLHAVSAPANASLEEIRIGPTTGML